MTKQVFIGLFTEGTTDERFLQTVVRKAFDEMAFIAPGDFEFFIETISINKAGLNYKDQLVLASREGVEKFGITILCVHRDADNRDDTGVFDNSILPAVEHLQAQDGSHCKVVVTVVPVQMTEAWLLADKRLFKEALGTSKSNEELGIAQKPELIANPKNVIEQAIRLTMTERPKRRRRELTIAQLYMPLGEQIDLKSLETLKAYKKFKESVRNAFVALNYLHN